MYLQFNINKVHIDLLLEYDNVKIVEKSNLKFDNYFEITTINEDKRELKMIIPKKEIQNANFNWCYFANPLSENSELVERKSNILSVIYDVKDIFEKKRFSEDYLKEGINAISKEEAEQYLDGTKYRLLKGSAEGCYVIYDLSKKLEKPSFGEEYQKVGYLWYPNSKRGKWSASQKGEGAYALEN